MKNVIGLCMLGLIFAGCDKQVKLTFVNETNRDLPLSLKTSSGVNESLGTVRADGGAAQQTFKFNKDELPVNVSWKAGDYCGKFNITGKTNKNMRIDFLPDGPSGPYKWKGKFKKQKHKKNKKQMENDDDDDEDDDD